MTWQGKSILTRIVVAAALAGLALIGIFGSRASAQTEAAQAEAAKAREAEAKAREAAASRAKEIQAKADALAEKARSATAKAPDGVTLDLSKVVRLKADNFEKSTRFPWPAVPRGSQKFAGVPVDIQGATMLWGQRNADAGLTYPEEVTGIPCQQKFETLYILHATFYAGASGQPSFDVVLNYQGGEKQTDTILCGEDTRDWYVNDPDEKELGPSSKRSTLAWTGKGKSGDREQAIRFCLTAIENKQPDRPVATIDLVASKKQTAGCILAITVGKSGLLKPHSQTPAVTSPPASP